MADPLPELSTADLEILLAALDPLLDGFGSGESCLDDARAFLERLRGTEATEASLGHWLQCWQTAGGNRATLRLMVSTLLAERAAARSASAERLPGDGEPHLPGIGSEGHRG